MAVELAASMAHKMVALLAVTSAELKVVMMVD